MKIAAFDSGTGGLIALAPLLNKKSNLDITYLGDLANLPYGTKSPKRIRDLTIANLEGLLKLEAGHFDVLVLACNTASAHALGDAKNIAKQNNSECLGVVEPACSWAVETATKYSSEASRIVVLATSATVKSQIYPTTLKLMGYPKDVLQIATPLFVPLVESEFENSPAADYAIQKYLGSHIKKGDIVILGCTHYPLLKNSLSKAFPFISHWIEAGDALLQKTTLKSLEAFRQKNKIKISFTDTTIDSAHIARLFKTLNLENSVEWELQTLSPFI